MKHTTALPLPSARRLRKGQFIRLGARQPLCLRAEHGTLWVTVDGRTADIVLDAGASRRFETGAALTVGTLGGDAVLTAVAWNAAGPRACADPSGSRAGARGPRPPPTVA